MQSTTGQRKLDRDIMNMLPVKHVALASMALIDRAQDLTPEEQVVAITATFKLLIERYNITAHDAFSVADNIINAADGRRVEFDAVRAYLANEV